MLSRVRKVAVIATAMALLPAWASAQTGGVVSPTPGGLDPSGGGGTGRERDMSNATRAAAGLTEAPAGVGATSGAPSVGAGAASGTVGGGVDSGSPR